MQQNDIFKTILNQITKILIYLSSQFHSSYHYIYMSHRHHRCHDHCILQYCCKKLSRYIERNANIICFLYIHHHSHIVCFKLIIISKNPYKLLLSGDQLKNYPLTSWRLLEGKNKAKKYKRVDLLTLYFLVVLMQKIVENNL